MGMIRWIIWTSIASTSHTVVLDVHIFANKECSSIRCSIYCYYPLSTTWFSYIGFPLLLFPRPLPPKLSQLFLSSYFLLIWWNPLPLLLCLSLLLLSLSFFLLIWLWNTMWNLSLLFETFLLAAAFLTDSTHFCLLTMDMLYQMAKPVCKITKFLHLLKLILTLLLRTLYHSVLLFLKVATSM